MPYEFKLPDLGEGIAEIELRKWLVKEGDRVAEHQSVLEVETDKVTVEIEAPADGTLAGVSAGDGAEVPVGTVIALVLAGCGAAGAPAGHGTPAQQSAPAGHGTSAGHGQAAAPAAHSRPGGLSRPGKATRRAAVAMARCRHPVPALGSPVTPRPGARSVSPSPRGKAVTPSPGGPTIRLSPGSETSLHRVGVVRLGALGGPVRPAGQCGTGSLPTPVPLRTLPG